MGALFYVVTVWLFVTPIAAIGTAITAFVVLTRRHRADVVASGDAVVQGNGWFRLFASVAFGYSAGALATAGAATATIIGALQSRGSGPANFDIGTVTLPIASSDTAELPDGFVPARVIDGFEFAAGYISDVSLVAPPISNDAAILYFAPVVIAPILHLVVAVGIGMLAASIDRRSAFAPGLVRVATGVGLSLLLLGLAGEVMGAIGIDRAAAEVFADSPLSATSGFGEMDLSVVVAGFAVLLVGALARRGLALQRDTEGLV